MAVMAAAAASSPATPRRDVDAIKTVHVVQACHLDIGFADSPAGIVKCVMGAMGAHSSS